MRRPLKRTPEKGVRKPPLGRRPPTEISKKSATPRPPAPQPPKLTPEQRQQIERLYKAMVVSGERPPEGRRRRIAAQLGVPHELVSEVVKSYLQHERLRRTNFDIEKIYWREVLAGQDDANLIAQRAAEELKLDVGRIWWWLQKLHEWPKTLHQDPDVNEEQKAAIVAAYEDYLKSSDPPEKGLHMTLSEKIGGVTPRQVHKTLLQYRLSFWKNLKNTIPT